MILFEDHGIQRLTVVRQKMISVSFVASVFCALFGGVEGRLLFLYLGYLIGGCLLELGKSFGRCANCMNDGAVGLVEEHI